MTTNMFKQINIAMVALFQCQYNLYNALERYCTCVCILRNVHYIGATQRRCDTFQYKITIAQEVCLRSIQEYQISLSQTQHPTAPLASHVYL